MTRDLVGVKARDRDGVEVEVEVEVEALWREDWRLDFYLWRKEL